MSPAPRRIALCAFAIIGACAQATGDDTASVDAFSVPDAPSTLADGPLPLPDAPPGAPDAPPGTPDAMSLPDATLGTPDAMSIPDATPPPPDATPPPPDAGFPGGPCSNDSQCPSGDCDELFGLCACDLIQNDCPGAEVCTLFIIPPGTYCDAP